MQDAGFLYQLLKSSIVCCPAALLPSAALWLVRPFPAHFCSRQDGNRLHIPFKILHGATKDIDLTIIWSHRDVLAENLSDPSHLPYAHSGVLNSRQASSALAEQAMLRRYAVCTSADISLNPGGN